MKLTLLIITLLGISLLLLYVSLGGSRGKSRRCGHNASASGNPKNNNNQ